MTDRAVMQQALEAMETNKYTVAELAPHKVVMKFNDAITALRTALAQEHALHELARLGQEIEQEPSQWRDMVVATLVREGINKHKARELADHFAAQPEPPPEWEAINNIIAEYGLQAIDFVADWKAAQRPWQGLTKGQRDDLSDKYGSYEAVCAIEQALKERNT